MRSIRKERYAMHDLLHILLCRITQLLILRMTSYIGFEFNVF